MSTQKYVESITNPVYSPSFLLRDNPIKQAQGDSFRSFSPEAMNELPLSDRILFESFGQGERIKPTYQFIHHAFEYYAKHHPDSTAIEHLDEHITYAELNYRAELLAKKLYAMGIRQGDNVGLFITRSIGMVVGILATLKLGAAYVPQHLGVATTIQLKHIIKVADLKVILTLSSLSDVLPHEHQCKVVYADQHIDACLYQHIYIPDIKYHDELLCFILFTSGTTGVPNGVKVAHKNLCNIILTPPGNLAIKQGQRVAQILNIAFDMAAWEVFSALCHGATLCIRGKQITDISPDVDTIIATPSILSRLVPSQFPKLLSVAVAGEPCPKSTAELWAKHCRFYNSCGPTETTIVNTMQHYCSSTAQLTIGAPTPNNTVYILNEALKPCRIGEQGMMWAGGACVTSGYLHNDELTQERYRPDPFLGSDKKMFRTGDLGCWTVNGELLHLGRADDQVKVRGFRVELDAVSQCLENVQGCNRAVTLQLDEDNLITFVCPENVSQNEMKAATEKNLPYYARPSKVIALPSLPITARGKIDKRLLMSTYEQQTASKEVELAHE